MTQQRIRDPPTRIVPGVIARMSWSNTSVTRSRSAAVSQRMTASMLNLRGVMRKPETRSLTVSASHS